MSIALVHDYLFEQGGAENVVEVLLDIFPDAPLYTSIYDPEVMSPAFRRHQVRTSFLQRITRRKAHAKALLPLYVPAFSSFDLSQYDVVLSSASSFAKFIRVRPDARHLCLCYTPTRFLWTPDAYLANHVRSYYWPLLRPLLCRLRAADFAAAQRVDRFIAISGVVAERIRTCYGRDAEVIYPPVDCSRFHPRNRVAPAEPYYLVVSRLLPYKRVDLAVQACSRLQLPLVIVGDGPDRRRLERLSGPTVRFVGRRPDDEVRRYLATCQALLFPGEEDFGLTAVEAQASGRPVIAFAGGGALETVIDGRTGLLFREQTVDALTAVLADFQQWSFDTTAVRQNALRFDTAVFREQIVRLMEGMSNATAYRAA